jgi:hypothetical protein
VLICGRRRRRRREETAVCSQSSLSNVFKKSSCLLTSQSFQISGSHTTIKAEFKTLLSAYKSLSYAASPDIPHLSYYHDPPQLACSWDRKLCPRSGQQRFVIV